MWCDIIHFSRVQYSNSDGKVGCRSSKSAKQKFKGKLKKLPSRKQTGIFEWIIKKINQLTVRWINYYGFSNMKSFMEEIQQWLNHRLRHLIWKRWKLPRTKYKMLRA